MDDLHKAAPSLLVISGDFTQRARAGQYALAAAYLKRLPTPRIVVPGNHDVPMYDFVRRFLFPLNRYFQYISTDLFPVYSDPELFALGVNTARSFTQKSGWLIDEQFEEIRRRFAAAPAGAMKVLVTHHPFIPPPDDPNGNILLRANDALRQLEESGVDLLLAGHLHRAYHNDVRSHHVTAAQSVLSIQAGTATSTRRRRDPNSWNWITLQPPGRATVSIRTWNGREFTETDVSRYEKAGGIWVADT